MIIDKKIVDEIKKYSGTVTDCDGDALIASVLICINNTLDEKLTAMLQSRKTLEGLLKDIHAAIREAGEKRE